MAAFFCAGSEAVKEAVWDDPARLEGMKERLLDLLRVKVKLERGGKTIPSFLHLDTSCPTHFGELSGCESRFWEGSAAARIELG